MAKVGDRIVIINMDGEPDMTGKEGIIEMISNDPWGDLRFDGTWGIALYPGKDSYRVIEEA